MAASYFCVVFSWPNNAFYINQRFKNVTLEQHGFAAFKWGCVGKQGVVQRSLEGVHTNGFCANVQVTSRTLMNILNTELTQISSS